MESDDLKNISHELIMLRRELEELKEYVKCHLPSEEADKSCQEGCCR